MISPLASLALAVMLTSLPVLALGQTAPAAASSSQPQPQRYEYRVAMPLTRTSFVDAVHFLDSHPFSQGSLELRQALMRWIDEDPSTVINIPLCKGQEALLTAATQQGTAALLFNQFTINNAASQIEHPDAGTHVHQQTAMVELLRMYETMRNKGVTVPYGEQVYAAYKNNSMAGLAPFLCDTDAKAAPSAHAH